MSKDNVSPKGGLNDIEPTAFAAPVGADIPALCAVSMAISLKRIADDGRNIGGHLCDANHLRWAH